MFEGDLPLYIFQISYVYFTLIKNTISIFQHCFAGSMSSSSIRWAKHHLDGFNALLSRQLSSVTRGSSIWDKCLDIVHEHAAQLNTVGVDFSDLVAQGLDDPSDSTGPRAIQPGELASPSPLASI